MVPEDMASFLNEIREEALNIVSWEPEETYTAFSKVFHGIGKTWKIQVWKFLADGPSFGAGAGVYYEATAIHFEKKMIVRLPREMAEELWGKAAAAGSREGVEE